MLLERSQTALHAFIAENEDLKCLKKARKHISWLRSEIKITQAFGELRDMIKTQLTEPLEKIILVNIDEYLNDDIPVKEITEAYMDHPNHGINTDWIVAYAVLQSLTLQEKVPDELNRLMTIFYDHISRRIQFLENKEESPKTNTGKITRRAFRVVDEMRTGMVTDPKTVLEVVEDALHKETKPLLMEALSIARILKRAEKRSDPIIGRLNQKPIDIGPIERDVHLLATKLERHNPSSNERAKAMSTLALFNQNPDLCARIGASMYEHQREDSLDTLATGFWALGMMETGKDTAALFAEILSSQAAGNGSYKKPLSLESTISSLCTMGVFDFDAQQAALLLDHARSFPLRSFNTADTARCFQTAVYFDHELPYWRERFQQKPPENNSWFTNKNPQSNPLERELYQIATSLLRDRDIQGRITLNTFRHGFECDILVEIPNRPVFVIELDGKHHQLQAGFDHFRDTIFHKMGDRVIRIPVKDFGSLKKKVEKNQPHRLMNILN